jgi:hypothetical protein
MGSGEPWANDDDEGCFGCFGSGAALLLIFVALVVAVCSG